MLLLSFVIVVFFTVVQGRSMLSNDVDSEETAAFNNEIAYETTTGIKLFDVINALQQLIKQTTNESVAKPCPIPGTMIILHNMAQRQNGVCFQEDLIKGAVEHCTSGFQADSHEAETLQGNGRRKKRTIPIIGDILNAAGMQNPIMDMVQSFIHMGISLLGSILGPFVGSPFGDVQPTTEKAALTNLKILSRMTSLPQNRILQALRHWVTQNNVTNQQVYERLDHLSSRVRRSVPDPIFNPFNITIPLPDLNMFNLSLFNLDPQNVSLTSLNFKTFYDSVTRNNFYPLLEPFIISFLKVVKPLFPIFMPGLEPQNDVIAGLKKIADGGNYTASDFFKGITTVATSLKIFDQKVISAWSDLYKGELNVDELSEKLNEIVRQSSSSLQEGLLHMNDVVQQMNATAIGTAAGLKYFAETTAAGLIPEDQVARLPNTEGVDRCIFQQLLWTNENGVDIDETKVIKYLQKVSRDQWVPGLEKEFALCLTTARNSLCGSEECQLFTNAGHCLIKVYRQICLR